MSFTDGTEVLLLGGDDNAIIESVELVGDDEIELVGAKLVQPGRAWGSIGRMPWPPRARGLDPALVIEAVGATITPRSVDEQGYELLLGMRVEDPGYYVRRGVRVNYRIADTHYSQYFPAVLSICTDPEELDKRGNCPPPRDWADMDHDPGESSDENA